MCLDFVFSISRAMIVNGKNPIIEAVRRSWSWNFVKMKAVKNADRLPLIFVKFFLDFDHLD